MILGSDSGDTFVENIRPGAKSVKLEDGTTIPILHNGIQTQRRSKPESMGIAYGHNTGDEVLLTLFRATVEMNILVQN